MFINNGKIECTPNNTYIVMYDNDMLDGILIDLDENYAFISAHSDGFDELADALESEGIDCFDMTGENIDLSEPPHSWIVHSIGRLILHEAELLLTPPQT